MCQALEPADWRVVACLPKLRMRVRELRQDAGRGRHHPQPRPPGPPAHRHRTLGSLDEREGHAWHMSSAEIHREQFVHLVDLAWDRALIAWGAFYFERTERSRWEIVDDEQLPAKVGRRTCI